MQLIGAYGVLGLLGFLGQMVAGVSARLLPLYAWMRDFSGAGFAAVPSPPHERPVAALQRIVFWGWLLAVPLLALGLVPAHLPSIRAAGLLLGAAAGAGLVQLGLLLRRRFPQAAIS
jgi:hypothetical protein